MLNKDGHLKTDFHKIYKLYTCLTRMEIVARLRRWGNSFGIVIPRDIIVGKNLRENEEVIIKVERKNDLKEIFGTLKGWKINSQKAKDEIREEEAEE